MRIETIIYIIFLSAALLLNAVAADTDYDEFAHGLNRSAIDINKFELPDLLYKLDQATAEEYFRHYFEEYPMTSALRVNLGYPVFCWNNNCENLQKGISPVLIEKLKRFFETNKTPPAISKAFAKDPVLHDDMFYTLIFLVDMAKSKDLDDAYKKKLQNQLLSILRSSGLTSNKYQKLDPERYTYVNSLKTQFIMTCFTFGKMLNDMNPLMKSIYLDPARKKLFAKYRVLVLDNKCLDMKQLRCIRNFMNSLPPLAQIPVVITCFNALGSKYNELITVHSFRCKGSFNIFNTPVGAIVTDQFPKDYKPMLADDFSIILAHEHNHQVDSVYVGSQPQLKAFKEQLLTQAGDSSSNYLRSMFDDGFFSKNPNEFVASLANQYFGDSKEMFRYALQKAEEGNLNQINQFILMASIYSYRDKCYFYSIDKRGNLKCRTYPVKRKNGLVTQLQVGSKQYSFDYNNGIIIAVSDS